MSNRYTKISKKLMQALNTSGHRLTYSNKQFVGRTGQTINIHSISKATWDPDKERYNHEELYSSASMIRILFFLRDMWYEHNGWELPTDQEMWNKLREELKDGGKYGSRNISEE